MKLKKGTIPIILGLLLIAAALGLSGFNIWMDKTAQAASNEAVEELIALMPQPEPEETAPAGEIPTLSLPDYVLDPEKEMPVKRVKGQDYIGTLAIPALELELPVISWWSGDRFQIAPCRYTGSLYTGNLILAAHNYPSHFGRIKELVPGDVLSFTDMDGNMFVYEVAQQEILQGTDVEEMESGEWDLTLFTCTVGGTYRVTVRCELKDHIL